MPRWNDLSDLPSDPRSGREDRKLKRERTIEVKRARAEIYLACETLGPHMSVLVLNAALREQLDAVARADRSRDDGR